LMQHLAYLPSMVMHHWCNSLLLCPFHGVARTYPVTVPSVVSLMQLTRFFFAPPLSRWCNSSPTYWVPSIASLMQLTLTLLFFLGSGLIFPTPFFVTAPHPSWWYIYTSIE
jgi:hypothetical protein